MGQRLVITLKKNDKSIATLYYHWSAYTESALEETKQVIDFLDEHSNCDKKELLLQLIRFAEKNGGGINALEEEIEYVKKLFPNETFLSDGYSRNNGLVALSKEGIKRAQGFSEGDVDIHIDTRMVDFAVAFPCDDPSEYAEECDIDANDINNIPKLDINLGCFSFDEIDTVLEEISDVGGRIVECRDDMYVLI